MCVCVVVVEKGVRSVNDHLVLPAAPYRHVTVGKKGVEKHCGFECLVPYVTAVEKRGYHGM